MPCKLASDAALPVARTNGAEDQDQWRGGPRPERRAGPGPESYIVEEFYVWWPLATLRRLQKEHDPSKVCACPGGSYYSGVGLGVMIKKEDAEPIPRECAIFGPCSVRRRARPKSCQ